MSGAAPEVKAVVSDLGDVFVRVDLGVFHRRLAGRSGLTPDEVRARLWDEDAWARYQRGDVSTEALVAWASRKLGVAISTDEFVREWCGIFPGLVDGIADLYRRVKARGVALHAFSNTNAPHVACLTRRFPEMALFERVFASHELRARKPEREAYLKVISALGLAPAECVFVDDDPANVEAAREVGMRAVLAEGTPSVEAGLRAMGVI